MKIIDVFTIYNKNGQNSTQDNRKKKYDAEIPVSKEKSEKNVSTSSNYSTRACAACDDSDKTSTEYLITYQTYWLIMSVQSACGDLNGLCLYCTHN